MADPLTRRVETAIESILATDLPAAQVLTWLEAEDAGKDYIAVRAIREDEDPPGSGIFRIGVTVVAHGQFSAANLLTLETRFNNAFALADAIRTAGSSSFVMPAGEAVELDLGSKTGVNLDGETTYNFALWAQTQEVNDAAA